MKSHKNKIIGIRAVEEALSEGKDFTRIYIQRGGGSKPRTDLMRRLRQKNIHYSQVPRKKIDHLSGGNHQGVLAYISPAEFVSLENLLLRLFESGETPLLMLLDRISDVRNFGAIARSAECFGAHGIVIPGKGSAMINETAVKASSGALLRIPVCKVKSLSRALEYSKMSGLQTMVADENGDEDASSADLTLPTAMILGAEGKGAGRELKQKSGKLIRIPLRGNLSSLNVSVAAGILLYEAARQRKVNSK